LPPVPAPHLQFQLGALGRPSGWAQGPMVPPPADAARRRGLSAAAAPRPVAALAVVAAAAALAVRAFGGYAFVGRPAPRLATSDAARSPSLGLRGLTLSIDGSQVMPGRRMTKVPPVVYTVIFARDEDAERAAEELDGEFVEGATITATLAEDYRSDRLLVNIQGVPPEVDRKLVRKLCESVAPVERVRRRNMYRFAQVKFENEQDAWRAKDKLHDSVLEGMRLKVEMDVNRRTMNWVMVHGIAPSCDQVLLSEHFEEIGEVACAEIQGEKVAIVQYERIEDTYRAYDNLRGLTLGGVTGKLKMRLITGQALTQGQGKGKAIKVSRMHQFTKEDQIRRVFGKVGQIADITMVKHWPLPPEFLVATPEKVYVDGNQGSGGGDDLEAAEDEFGEESDTEAGDDPEDGEPEKPEPKRDRPLEAAKAQEADVEAEGDEVGEVEVPKPKKIRPMEAAKTKEAEAEGDEVGEMEAPKPKKLRLKKFAKVQEAVAEAEGDEVGEIEAPKPKRGGPPRKSVKAGA